MHISHLVAGATALGIVTVGASAQEPRIRAERAPTVIARAFGNERGDRAFLGVTTSSGSKRDTLGLLVTGVTSGSPAEKAGIEEGNRIASINGVSLRLSRDDAGEDDMDGVLSNRLTRELRKVKAGDEVTLELYADGRTRTVRVKTAEPSAARAGAFGMGTMAPMSRMREEMDSRAAIGVGFGLSGSKRDTLGVLVAEVDQAGPAAKAGIEEGNRIASINGVDLRVRSEDAGDADGGSKAQRVSRELAKLKPGDEVELRIYADGQSKTVHVKTVKASELRNFSGMRFRVGDGANMPMPSMRPGMRMPDAAYEVRSGQMDETVRRALERAREGVERARIERGRSLDHDDMDGPASRLRNRIEMAPLREGRGPGSAEMIRVMPRALSAAGEGGSFNFNLRGLRLVPMSKDLASYFGDDAADGLLVLDAAPSWPGVRGGDVLLSVNGKAVRDGDNTSVSLDSSRENQLELLRKGKRMTVTVPSSRKEP